MLWSQSRGSLGWKQSRLVHVRPVGPGGEKLGAAQAVRKLLFYVITGEIRAHPIRQNYHYCAS